MARRGNLEMRAVRFIRFIEKLQGIAPEMKIPIQIAKESNELQSVFVDVTGRGESARSAWDEAMHALYGTPVTVTPPKRRKGKEQLPLEEKENEEVVTQ